ncbi:winged helix-turn-helix domain-containing protein [Photorhabdus laumondii]
MPTTQAVLRLVEEGWDISYTVPGMNKWLDHNGFSDKKPDRRATQVQRGAATSLYGNLRETQAGSRRP